MARFNVFLISLVTMSQVFAQKAKPAPQPPAAAKPAAPQVTASESAEDSQTSKVKDSKFRIQVGLMTGLQSNPIQSNSIVQGDVSTMTTSVNAINQGAASSSPQAAISNQSAAVFSVPAGISLQTIFFDFIRLRTHVTYDAPITYLNQFTDKSSGVEKKYSSEVRVTQIQAPLLLMFDIPISKENTLYIGGGPTLYWGRIEKGIREDSSLGGKSDLDRFEGFAYGPTFIIGAQRRMGSLFSIHADILYQSGAKGGYVDKLQNGSTDNTPGGFSDLSGNSGSEKFTTDGSFNSGAPKIMNFEGIRFLVGLNIHLDL